VPLLMPHELSSAALSSVRSSQFAGSFSRTKGSRKIAYAYRHLRGAFKPCFHSLL
jgi:hypothetical protein